MHVLLSNKPTDQCLNSYRPYEMRAVAARPGVLRLKPLSHPRGIDTGAVPCLLTALSGISPETTRTLTVVVATADACRLPGCIGDLRRSRASADEWRVCRGELCQCCRVVGEVRQP